ncbi:MAG TPA: NAD(P)H-hydrate dehydratase [Candidatus Limnocylindrales bacterium]|nr:NAD(P)H-hydrate dehydratase [Candidatus Limnocylindrales bacterium]
MKALTAAEMREVDRLTTERFGVPSHQLMEAAGKSVTEVFLEEYGHRNSEPPGRVAVLCGKGNNGGDGFVVARHMKDEAEQVSVYLFAKPDELRGDAARNFARWREQSGSVTVVESEADWEKAWGEVSGADVIIDALLGTGVRGPATGLIAQAIEDVNRLSRNATAARPGWIVAVDTPSGLPSDGEAATGPVMHAHWTLTFTAPKLGQLISAHAGCCGQLVVRNIGSPAALIEEIGKGKVRWAGADEFAGLPLLRAADAHKGSYGHVLIVAGSLGKSGAAVLAGEAALRGGAGLTTIAVPEPVLPIIAGSQPEYMTESLPATSAGTFAASALKSGCFAEVARNKTVLAVGPGVGQHPKTQEFIRGIVAKTDLPIVLDADGLNAFAGHGDLLAKRKSPHLVVTPHPGEMARLVKCTTAEVQRDRVRSAVAAAKKWNAHVALKGFHTVLASPTGAVFVNTTGNPALAKGGSGDVLTGLLAAMIAQFGTHDLLRAVALGVYLHGRAADLLSEQSEPTGILAGEVAQAIPYARRKLLEELQARG